MIITYEIIREVKQKEKMEGLQKLPENFFENAAAYLELKKGTLEESAAKNLILSLFELRKKKILNLASLSYKTDTLPENLEPEEKKLYLNLVKVLREYQTNFETILTQYEQQNKKHMEEQGETEELVEKEIKEKNSLPEKTKNLENETKYNKVKVIFLKDLPELLLPSGETRSFKRGEEKELDEDFAEILIDKGFCKLL